LLAALVIDRPHRVVRPHDEQLVLMVTMMAPTCWWCDDRWWLVAVRNAKRLVTWLAFFSSWSGSVGTSWVERPLVEWTEARLPVSSSRVKICASLLPTNSVP